MKLQSKVDYGTNEMVSTVGVHGNRRLLTPTLAPAPAPAPDKHRHIQLVLVQSDNS